MGNGESGARLPSRARLAEEYGVGRNVTQRAVDRLIVEGLLEGRTGSGTYVRTPRERLRIVRSRHRDRPGGASQERGRATSWDAQSEAGVPAPKGIAERLAISPGDLCVTTHYEFLTDGRPVQLSWSWGPLALTEGTPVVVLPERGPLAGRGRWGWGGGDDAERASRVLSPLRGAPGHVALARG